MALKKQLKRLLNDETGQSTTEYILILAIVVMIAMKFKEQFQGRLLTIVGNVANDIDKAAQQ